MKTFDEIYEELKSGETEEINQLWKSVKKDNEKAKKIGIIICLIIDIFLVAIFAKNIINSSSIFLIFFAIMFVLVFNFIIYSVITVIGGVSKNYIQFRKQYKNIVIKKLMNNFYNNLEYFPYKQMPEYIYNKQNYEYYNKYESDDYIEGQIDNKYSIQMAEILTQEERTYKNKDGETETEIITKFHGLFAKVVMHKSINGELQIVQDGGLADNLKMDSSEFEKYFDVRATDKIVGMQLLTADVMEELIQFENQTNMKYEVFIKDNELYLRFHSGEMFEVPDIKKEALDKSTIHKYFYMLNFTYNLSKRLINLVNETLI